MSTSKRKQASKSTVTLHDFFDPGAASSKKSNQRDRNTPGRNRIGKKTLPSNVPANVIIIDSDSEPEIVQVIQKKKRRRQSNSSGEVEFVNSDTRPLGKRPTATNDTSGDKHQPPYKKASILLESVSGQTSSLLNPALAAFKSGGREKQVYSFGAPTLLLQSTVTAAATPDLAPSLSSLSFGPPTLLLASNPVPTQAESSSRAAAIQQSSEVSYDDVQLDLDFSADAGGDEWRTGDDETAFVSVPDDEEEEILVDFSYETEATLPRCPSCDIAFNGQSQTEISVHVNNCLDSITSPEKIPSTSTATLDPKSKLFRPLSAFSPPKVQGPLQLISCDGKIANTQASNAFAVLMHSHKENEAWKEATIAEDRNFRPTKGNEGRRKAPFYKVLQGMPIAVDAFRYSTIPGVTAYFLTHAHSDHYTNLASNWKSGPIYCSEGTANLIIHMLSVDRKWVHPLPMDVPTIVPNTGGVRVTLIEANHCPGSCLFYFEGPQTINAGDSAFKSSFVGSLKIFRYLHCGDFRASPQHVLHPAIKGKRIDHVYLDTTYLDPKYTFPPQPLVISACAELARRLVSGQSISEGIASVDTWMKSPNEKSPAQQGKATKMLIVVGTYSIGKERIVKAVAHALQTKIYCDARKAAILRCQADPELDALLTSNPLEASVHLVPLGIITSDKLKTYVERFKGVFGKAVGLRPTGWTYTQPAGTDQMPSVASIVSRPHRNFTYANLRPARNSTSALQLFPIPYSEHSSFFELTCFAMSFDWGKMIATVNVGSETSRNKMAKWVAKWEAERKKRGKDVVVPHRNLNYW